MRFQLATANQILLGELADLLGAMLEGRRHGKRLIELCGPELAGGNDSGTLMSAAAASLATAASMGHSPATGHQRHHSPAA